MLCLPLCSLMIPFLRLGEFITGGPHFPLTADALKKVFSGEASKEVLLSIFRAVSEEVFASEHLFLPFFLISVSSSLVRLQRKFCRDSLFHLYYMLHYKYQKKKKRHFSVIHSFWLDITLSFFEVL